MPRIDTTIVEWNAPAERHSIDVSYIGTLRPAVMCRTGTPASITSSSGQGLGLRCANSRKSNACSLGRIIRFACA